MDLWGKKAMGKPAKLMIKSSLRDHTSFPVTYLEETHSSCEGLFLLLCYTDTCIVDITALKESNSLNGLQWKTKDIWRSKEKPNEEDKWRMRSEVQANAL